MDYHTLFAIASNVVLLPVLSLSLLIAYMNKKEFLKKTGFDKSEIGIIIVGSLFGLVADIPLIVSGESLLNINLGGALLPIIVCGSLIYKKKLNIPLLSFGTAAVSIVAYSVTRYEAEMGIVAEFPFYFLPSFTALALSLILGSAMKKGEFFIIPYAYTISVLGNLIGADLVRIPSLIQRGILGSIGGAGAMDMVYLSGLIASVPLVFLYYPQHSITPSEKTLDKAENCLKIGKYTDTREMVLQGVQEEINKAYKLLKRNIRPSFALASINSTGVLKRLGINIYVIQDYHTLWKSKKHLSYEETKRDFITGKLLVGKIRKRINEIYSSLPRRVLAYVIDLIIMTVPFIMFFIVILISREPGEIFHLTGGPIFLAVFSLATSIHFLYFTILEWYFGRTVGKALLGLKVLDDNFDDISFVQSAARNSGRYADMLLFFYLVSLVIIQRSSERKRIGDHIAGTRVVKTK